jgi:hypothetical protein
VRQIRMLRAMRRGITVPPTRARRGKPRTRPRSTYGLPRQFPTLPRAALSSASLASVSSIGFYYSSFSSS